MARKLYFEIDDKPSLRSHVKELFGEEVQLADRLLVSNNIF